MAKTSKSASPAASLLHGLFQVGVYKGTQGRITRQVTFATLAVAFALAAWRLYESLRASPAVSGTMGWLFGGEAPAGALAVVRYGLPALLLAAGLWFSYRIVNYPRFADFLVAVEAEMNKVSWPSRPELIRASIVVIVVIFSLAAVLFAYDLFWEFLFRHVLRVLQ